MTSVELCPTGSPLSTGLLLDVILSQRFRRDRPRLAPFSTFSFAESLMKPTVLVAGGDAGHTSGHQRTFGGRTLSVQFIQTGNGSPSGKPSTPTRRTAALVA